MARFGTWTARIVGLAGALLAPSLLMAGCGGSTSSGPSGPIPQDQLATRFASAVCDSLGACCSADGNSFDNTTCRKNAEAGFAETIARLTLPDIRYDAAAAGACVDAYVSVIRSCHEDQSRSIDTACKGIFVGAAPAGATCTLSDECASPAGSYGSCQKTLDSVTGMQSPTGTCVVTAGSATTPATHGKAGDSCAGDCTASVGSGTCSVGGSTAGGAPPVTTLCYKSEGLYCSFPGGTCAPLAAIGKSCSSGGCVTGAFCDASICAAQRSSGSCAGAFDACSADAYCDYLTNECHLKLPDGSACTDSAACQGGRCLHAVITATATPSDGGGTATTAVPGVCAKKTFTTPDACMGIDVGLD